MYKKVDSKANFPKMEEEILEFWEKQKIFEKSVEKPASSAGGGSSQGDFIFYEGPPTANGRPGLHHVLARAFKDIIPRYKTMKGYRVERKAGWDTHGLPVELQVEKALGLKNKQDIENIVSGNPRESIIEFNKHCKESVWEYKDLWEKMTRRMGYWVDMKNPYVTYHNEYIESVWWVVSQISKVKDKKGESLIYQGHKVISYCYRCGTTLSSHEVAQGYQKVKDSSVFIKFYLKPGQKWADGKYETKDSAYILVWTTTPWTLPGNVALAVGKNISYTALRVDGVKELIIVASDLVKNIFEDKKIEIVHDDITGKDLLGLEYEPLYETNDTNKKAYYVVPGDFVTTQEGTGIVHIAPAFGEDDSNVGKENDLPTLITVDLEGKITADVPGKGMAVKKKNDKGNYAVDDLIAEDLLSRNLLFKQEKYEHDYPFCWRCDTPLIYYAKPSWFIRMSELSEELVKNNEPINWIPEYIKNGRFGEWLSGVKDWAISRERYWGTPLPIWKCEKCEEKIVIESIKELREKSEDKITQVKFIRHGESERNISGILTHSLDGFPLTKRGVEVAKEQAEKFHDIDVIISSPLLRTKQTAEIVAKKLGVEIIYDSEISEYNMGEWNDMSKAEREARDDWKKLITLKGDEAFNFKFGVTGETRNEVVARVEKFIKKISQEYAGKNVLIVSHGGINAAIKRVLENISDEEYIKEEQPDFNSVHIFYTKENGEPFDLHKPYIDEITFQCSCGSQMKRVPEVMDVWFDSGSMPLAQFHYPNGASEDIKKKIEGGEYFPADYISEAIDQTRGWFYTLHAIATLLNKNKKVPQGYAFKNVICLAHILDAKGKKMSKSRGNVIEPMEVMDEYGADMLRWMLYTINQPGMPKRFDLKGMRDIMNRVFRMMWNSYSFFVMYANIDKFSPDPEYKLEKTENLLDRWVISELNILAKGVDEKLAAYDIYSSAKSIEVFIDNLSNWYIRRSRRRFWKSESDSDKKEAYKTLHYVLITLAKLMAPFTPFIAEEIFRNLTSPQPSPYKGEGGEKPSPLQGEGARRADEVASVHLEDFPEADEKLIDEKLNVEMKKVREIITQGLQLRAEAKIKVRQPLSVASIKYLVSSMELKDIIKEELNVKEVAVNEKQEEEISLDTNITEELKLEGIAREIIRHIQEMRKEAGYEVDNRIKIGYSGQSSVFQKFGDLIAKETLADELGTSPLDNSDFEKKFSIEDQDVNIYIRKN